MPHVLLPHIIHIHLNHPVVKVNKCTVIYSREIGMSHFAGAETCGG